jgi:hypothetical protein
MSAGAAVRPDELPAELLERLAVALASIEGPGSVTLRLHVDPGDKATRATLETRDSRCSRRVDLMLRGR